MIAAAPNANPLAADVARVRALLEARRDGTATPAPQPTNGEIGVPLRRVCTAFGLSPFERDVLVLCAGAEVDASFAELCASLAPGPGPITFGLALDVLEEPHWSALSPHAPLRLWRLVTVSRTPGAALTVLPLGLDERILHALLGIDAVADELVPYLATVSQPGHAAPSGIDVAARIAGALAREPAVPATLFGADAETRLGIAAHAADILKRPLLPLDAHALPTHADDLDRIARGFARESLLVGAMLYVAVDADHAPAIPFLRRARVPAIIGGEGRPPSWPFPARAFTAAYPTVAERKAAWEAVLPPDTAPAELVERVSSEFQLSVDGIRRVAADAAAGVPLWDAARAAARVRLDDLAQRIEPFATWHDLVVDAHALTTLRTLVAHVAHRTTVYERWGFAARANRGLGISALFTGPSGTGKTMAAEVIALELGLDLYRIDLAAVVSKYIGETERNLRRVFDGAEGGGAVLFFDEADALFGKRTEVRDSHDRYANIEIDYLLQRIELFGGLAILATNNRGAIDAAFMRRLRFIVHFTMPDRAQREALWRRAFPAETPLGDVQFERLAAPAVSGASIRNIALAAAFLAAQAGTSVTMRALADAARSELAKLEQSYDSAEITAWAEAR